MNKNGISPAAAFVVVPLSVCFSLGYCAANDSAQKLGAAAKSVTQIIAHRGASAERPECTLAAIRRAIEVGATAVEVDVRTSRDGELFILHDATLDRTTNGKGIASERTLAELQQLDAGSSFDPAYQGERIPSLIEAAVACRGKIDLLLDLKEQGDDYDQKVVNVIREHGDPAKTIVGVRSVAQAKRFRRLLPQAKQLALIPSVESIEQFAEAGADTIRLWPRWLAASDAPVKRVRDTAKRLHLNGTMGELDETLELLRNEPDSLSSDHPARLKKALAKISRVAYPSKQLGRLIQRADGTRLRERESRVGAATFLNRDYQVLELPNELSGMPGYSFNGGAGTQVRLRFRNPTVVFAAFDYNDSGHWSFEDDRPPTDFGWHLWRADCYRGSSNPDTDGKPNRTSIWFREFKPEQELSGLPAWWLCLGIVDLETARGIEGFKAGLVSEVKPLAARFSHPDAAAPPRPLQVPDFDSDESFRGWQNRQRERFTKQMLYPYEGKITVVAGPSSDHQTHYRQEFHVSVGDRRLFRFFRMESRTAEGAKRHPAIVCFMGHGKVAANS